MIQDMDLELDFAGSNSVLTGGRSLSAGNNFNIRLEKTPAQLPNQSPTWQIVRKGKKRARKADSDGEFSQIAISNKYASIALNDDALLRQPTNITGSYHSLVNTNINKTEPKLLPIFVPDVNSIKDLVTSLNKIVDCKDYHHKTLDSSGQLKLTANNAEVYRKIVHALVVKGASFHSYQLKQEHAFRVVIRSLHPSTPTSKIKEEVEKRGHKKK